jgi:hypothetical protein
MLNPHGFTLPDLLFVEDDPALLLFSCEHTGVLLWPLVRTLFLRMVLSDLLYGTSLSAVSGKSLASADGMRTLLKSTAHNCLRRPRSAAEICLMATALGHQHKDGKIFNRLCDHFALSMPQRSVVLEDQHDWRWPFPRHFDRVLFHSPIVVQSALAGRLLVREAHRRRAEALIDLVCSRARGRLGWEPDAGRRALLVNVLARKLPQVPFGFERYRRLFSRLGTRLLLKEDGCFGSSAVAIAAARSLGIVTAEYQHGAVSAGHDAYNVAPTLASSVAYRATLPEYFLAYGEWWNEQMSVPVRKVAVGNPHRSEQLSARRATGCSAKTDILVLGDGVETALYLDLVARLQPVAERLGLRLVFRPHPMERRVFADRPAPNGFVLDVDSDIYGSLERAYAVISEVSTGLFEAVGLAERVLMWDTPKARFAFPTHPFQTFTTLEELQDILSRPTEGQLDPRTVERTWAPEWKANYRRFVDETLAQNMRGLT